MRVHFNPYKKLVKNYFSTPQLQKLFETFHIQNLMKPNATFSWITSGSHRTLKHSVYLN